MAAFGSIAPSNQTQAASYLADASIAAGYTPASALGENGILTAIVASLLIDGFPAGAGTAAAPSISTTGDSDTGFYFSAANTVAVSAAGAQVATFSATGLRLTGATAALGYGTGAGGAVTQITSRSTGVTLSKVCGQITTDATSLAAGAEAVFVVTNTLVAATDTVVLSAASGQTAGTSVPLVTAVAAGSFSITLTNLHASTADTGAMIINFAVIKAVAA